VKPLYRPGPTTFRAIESFLHQQDVPEHDVYLCCADSAPEGWAEQHPRLTWLRLLAPQDRNGKAATLALGSRIWSGDIFVISDADMWAEPDYLARVLAPFEDPKVGVVTCLYRSTPPRAGDWCHLLESLCILDFSASVLVARKTEGITFAMGSTMAIRRETLEQIGGFEALTPYLADDYQLGQRAHRAGWKVALASTVLETEPPTGRLDQALSHQYRWLVTSRVSRPGGHFAFVVTQGFLWASLLCLLSPGVGLKAMLAWVGLRWLCGYKTHRDLGGRRGQAWQVLFLPWKDALYLGLWFASLRGNTVRWGERELTIDSQGRILG
jgi:ceramide glucosyltransferase